MTQKLADYIAQYLHYEVEEFDIDLNMEETSFLAYLIQNAIEAYEGGAAEEEDDEHTTAINRNNIL
jgi:hypothetical protein